LGYEEARGHLDALGIDAMKSLSPSLHRIEAMCDAMASPQRSFPSIHITGTNGKTSVAAITSALLREIGLNVGTFTSPHLHTVRERISLNGEPIPEGAFGEVFDHLTPYREQTEARLGERLSYFETLVGMFFLWAGDQPVDVAVVEVGLGGRWDATNVMDGTVAVLTNVALDHTAMLGGDRVTIAKEKSGIVKAGAVVVTGERSPDVLQVIGEAADGAHATLASLDKDFGVVSNLIAVDGRAVSIRTRARDYEDLFLPLHGAHQGTNAAIALEAVTSFLPEESLEDDVVAAGFASAHVPGRMERINRIILDVAHNPTGASALVGSLVEEFSPDQVLFVVGVLDDKDHVGIMTELARLPARIIATRAKSDRSRDPRDLLRAAEELGLPASLEESVSSAMELAVREVGDVLVCVTGSHYVVGEARAYLLASSGRK